MKKTLKLIPAIVMLLVSAILVSTASYAWFSMNTVVTAQNMVVKAIAEQGILINEVAAYDDDNWDSSANTTAHSAISLRATSTANTQAWYVAYSKVSNSSASGTSSANSTDLTAAGYSTLGSGDYVTTTNTTNATAGSVAKREVTYVDFDNGSDYDDGEGYYVKYTYYIKSSADELDLDGAANAQHLKITPTVTGNTTSLDLDKALRVAVVIDSKAYIFAPLNSSAGTYYVSGSHTATTPLTGDGVSLATIPATTVNGIEVNVYLWFEGEDTNLKTDNITSTLDSLTVSVAFELTTHTSVVTDNGIALT